MRRELDPETEAWLDEKVAAAPPFSPDQERLIIETFQDADRGGGISPKQAS
jgi:hypothetical protein